MSITILTPDYDLSVLEAYYAFNGVSPGTFEAPVGVNTIKSVGLAEQRATGTVYASGGILKSISRQNASQLTVGATALPIAFKRRALGRAISANVGFSSNKTGDVPLEFAFGYATEYSSGKQVFHWCPRCTLVTADASVETKTDGAENPNSSYVILAMPFGVGKNIEIVYDQSEVVANKVPLTGAQFFAAVISSLTNAIVDTETAGVAPAVLALSSIAPLDGSTTMSKTGVIVLTFSNPIIASSIALFNTATGDPVAVTPVWDAAAKVLTLTPTVALAATTKYIVAISSVTDVYGQVLAATGKDFTTVV